MLRYSGASPARMNRGWINALRATLLLAIAIPRLPITGRVVELEGVGLQLPIEVSAAHDDRGGIALNRRHGLEGKGAAISVGVLASAAHAAFGLVVHGVTSQAGSH